MKKFLILITAGTAFAFASCASTGGCCGKCKKSCEAKAECSKKDGSCESSCSN